MKQYPIERPCHPNWPTEMRCDGCGFKGWQWMGITKLLWNLYSQHYNLNRCSKCGVGVMKTSEGGALPLFILKT